MVDPPLCESGDSRIVTGHTPNLEKWQIRLLRWSEKPEESDRYRPFPQDGECSSIGRAFGCEPKGSGIETHLSHKECGTTLYMET